MANSGLKTWKMAVRLAKEGYTKEQCIKMDKIEQIEGITILQLPFIDGGFFFAGKAFASPPKWQTFFDGYMDLPQLTNRGAVCVLIVPVTDRLMFITFGPAQSFLNIDSFERDFGMKVTLNSVNDKELVSVDASSTDEQNIKRKIHTSRKSDINAFSINTQKDILKGVAGNPEDRSFASLVAGSDTLFFYSKISPNDIIGKCEKILEFYNSDKYQEKFKWVDNVRLVKDKQLIEKLDNSLEASLISFQRHYQSEHFDYPDIFIAIPELTDYEQITGYSFSGFGKRPIDEVTPSLELADYMNLLGDDTISLERVRKNKVGKLIDGHEKFIPQWSVYQCLVFNTEVNERSYILSEGDWYQVDDSFSEEINTFFNEFLATTDPKKFPWLPDAKKTDNETTYNSNLENNLPNELVCFDKKDKAVKPDDWNSSVEACDFYSSSKDFIHIKDYKSSSTLSHLFMQGFVSARAFMRDRQYRNNIKKYINATKPAIAATIPDSRISTSEYRIVYAILRKPHKNGLFDLPFFSKVSLKSTVEQLADLNYQTCLLWIKKII